MQGGNAGATLAGIIIAGLTKLGRAVLSQGEGMVDDEVSVRMPKRELHDFCLLRSGFQGCLTLYNQSIRLIHVV